MVRERRIRGNLRVRCCRHDVPGRIGNRVEFVGTAPRFPRLFTRGRCVGDGPLEPWFEEAFDGVEDLAASTATNPAFGCVQ